MNRKFRFVKISICFCIICCIAPADHAISQTPDWSTGIAAILYDHCSHCHHEGAIAPFSLMTYDDAVTWGFSMATQVNAGIMPPWPPDPYYNHLMNENVLSAEEIDKINLWVNNGMPAGDLSLAPAQPVFNGSSLMLNPDETVKLPVFPMPSTGNVYWRFVNQSGYMETKYINSIEFVAGNPSVIHHVTVGLDDSGLAWEDDQNYPGPGCPRNFGNNPGVKVFMAQSEGRVITLPQNLGFEVPAANDYVTDMHYFVDSIGEIDSSKINLKFCEVSAVRPVTTEKQLYGNEPSLLDGPLEIPANTVRTFHLTSKEYTEDKSLLGLGPHSHQICTSWEVFLVVPTGDTIPLIKIPHWDFDWQGGYLLTKVLKIPAGSRIAGTVTYDNTVNNPNNPSNPPQDVYGNGSMLGEMAQVHTWEMDYQEGDEDIILDSSFYGVSTNAFNIKQANSLNVFPNPVSAYTTVSFLLSTASDVTIELIDVNGRMVNILAKKKFPAGKHDLTFHRNAISAGIYFLQVKTIEGISMKKLVIE